MWPKPPINYIHALIDRCVAMKGEGGVVVLKVLAILCFHVFMKSSNHSYNVTSIVPSLWFTIYGIDLIPCVYE